MRFIKSIFKQEILIAVLAVGVLAVLSYTDFIRGLEWQMYDNSFIYKRDFFKRNIEESKKLVFLDIDDAALKRVGRWPWSRQKIAEFLSIIKEFEPKAIIFDIEFVEKQDPSLDYDKYKSIREELVKINNIDDKVMLEGILKQIKKKFEEVAIMNDELFADAIEKANNVYLTVRGKEFKIDLTKLLEYESKIENRNIPHWKRFLRHYQELVHYLSLAKNYEHQNQFLKRFDLNRKQKRILLEMLEKVLDPGVKNKLQLVQSMMIEIIREEIMRSVSGELAPQELQAIFGYCTTGKTYDELIQAVPSTTNKITRNKFNHVSQFFVKLLQGSGISGQQSQTNDGKKTYTQMVVNSEEELNHKWLMTNKEKNIDNVILKIGDLLDAIQYHSVEKETDKVEIEMLWNDVNSLFPKSKRIEMSKALLEEVRKNKEKIMLANKREEYIPIIDIVNQVKRTSGISSNTVKGDIENLIHPANIEVVVEPIYRNAKGFGLTNAETDADGTLRDLALCRVYETPEEPKQTIILPQLAFRPFLDIHNIKDEDIEIIPGEEIVLKNVKLLDKHETVDLHIPIDEEARTNINWVPKNWASLFSHVSCSAIFNYANYKKEVEGQINNIDAQLANLKAQLDSLDERIVNNPEPDNIKRLKDEKIRIEAEIKQNMKNKIDIQAKLSSFKEFLRKKLKGMICFLGLTATATSDIGSIPVDSQSPLVTAHANLWNTLEQNDFIKRSQRWENILITLLFCLFIGYLATKLKTIWILITGVGFVVLYIFLQMVLFSYTGKYYELTFPVLSMVFTFVGITMIKYLASDKEKKFIKNAFGQYLSPMVIDQLIKDPSKLNLGGERKQMTAFFSDVQGFSSISEKLTPEELVALLNDYLTDMCDIIAKYHGTVDKFEGDAIIGFWGAPLDDPKHAVSACYTSIEMQKRMVELRKIWKQQNKPEMHMRIGLNSGPMVVGNMGSATRMDYTMMGDNVNLAARLEGANKFYKTFTMISGATYELAKDYIEVRELDKIRVVGKKEPVAVYELLDRKGELDATLKQLVEVYNNGLEHYKNLQWDEAIEQFKKCLEIVPDDGPAVTYIERCEAYKENPPDDDWDGVYTLTSKG